MVTTGIGNLGSCKKEAICGEVTKGVILVGVVGLIICWVAVLFRGLLTCEGLDPRGILDEGSSVVVISSVIGACGS